MSDVVGFIGAGQLGEPMINRLLRAGHAVVVYARRSDVRGRIKNLGGSLEIWQAAGAVPKINEAAYDNFGLVDQGKDEEWKNGSMVTGSCRDRFTMCLIPCISAFLSA
jgi:nucleoside-diphosphate-sugar epimerase